MAASIGSRSVVEGEARRGRMAEQGLPAEVHIHVGEEEIFALPNHGAGGYRWQVVVSGDSATASIGYDESGPSPARPPGLGERLGQVLHVRGVRAGEGRLALEERRSWEQGTPAAVTVRVVVTEAGPGHPEQR
jgi:Chagasin family peptidase inhibitor I42